MLKPSSDRLNYSDLLKPPEGYQTDFALGTTYSLNLEALLGVPLALFLSEEMNKSILNNPILVLDGLRRSADQFALLCEGGQIKVPQNQNTLFSFLEDSVFEVALPHDFSFHPKVWIIRYHNKSKQPLYRLLVLSRNLTFDRSWDLAVCLEGRVAVGTDEIVATSKQNEPLIKFVDYLRDKYVDNRKKQNKIKKIQEELENIRFETKDSNYPSFSFHPLGIPDYTNRPAELFDYYNDLLIISPFISKRMVERLTELALSNSTRTLITQRPEITKLSEELLDKFDVYVMKESVVEGEEGLSGDDLGGEHYQSQDIHAKFYARSKNAHHSLFVGSANCSEHAFGGNVEFLLHLRYRKHGFRVRHLLDDLFGTDERDNPFEQIKIPPEVDEFDTTTTDLLEKAIKQLCRTHPKASVSKEGSQYRITIKFASIPNDLDLTIASTAGTHPVKLEKKTTIPLLPLDQLSEFYQVTASKEEAIVRRIIKIKTIGIPEGRNKAVFKSIISTPEKFMKYIELLIADSRLLSSLEQMNIDHLNKDPRGVPQLFMPVFYENMLKMVAREPERLKDIDDVVALVDDSDINPPTSEFNEMYQAFSQAVKKVKE